MTLGGFKAVDAPSRVEDGAGLGFGKQDEGTAPR